MDSRVLNVLILLAVNFCCSNGDIVSIVKSSTSTVSNWYDYYIKPLWTRLPFSIPSSSATATSFPTDADVSFYENEDINYSPSIQDENVVLMDLNDEQVLLSTVSFLIQEMFYILFYTKVVDWVMFVWNFLSFSSDIKQIFSWRI